MYFIYEDSNGNKDISIEIDDGNVQARKSIKGKLYKISKQCDSLKELAGLLDRLVKLPNEFWKPVVTEYKPQKPKCTLCGADLNYKFGQYTCSVCGGCDEYIDYDY